MNVSPNKPSAARKEELGHYGDIILQKKEMLLK